MIDELRFDLCADLKPLDHVAEADQVRRIDICSCKYINEGCTVCKWVKSMPHKNEQERG